ncbi:MAG TPA: Rrf2 family transcriptional regulator [Ferrovibrio sp.]|jgi:Rrf2 family nitric oxide-sensitive transcriptional repressor|uniref:RrF2 family transcriptional regulator n=1 Tax=Ferrovibrio sp. TaxID=1917215 RepID=UPI002ED2AB14
MRLTLHTDYALRLLMYLGLHADRRCTIEEIAESYGISRNHLMKVALTLTQQGFVDSQRGRNGGLMLGQKPEAIRVGAVVRATEDNFTLVECFDRATNTCLIAPNCRLKQPFGEAVEAFLAVLDRYTLADMLGNPSMMRGLNRLLGAA